MGLKEAVEHAEVELDEITFQRYEIRRLKDRIESLEELVTEYRREAARLHGLLCSAGINPRTGLPQP